MSKSYSCIDAEMAEFIGKQHVFFVATAPLSGEGHINLSPKGLDSLAIVDERTVAYLDLTGSGIETVAHLRENGRIVIMLCAFEGPPKIVRLHGRGQAIEPGHAEFAALRSRFPGYSGARAIIKVALDRISDSCGYGVPAYEFKEHRKQLPLWVDRKGEERLAAYRAEHNTRSIDGLPGLG